MILHDCAQNDADWLALRAGIPTASEFACLLAKGKDGGVAKTRKSYLHRLCAERFDGPVETYTNGHMERGHEIEPEARDLYALTATEPVVQVGFITDDAHTVGCSPDALVGSAGALEIKTRTPQRQVELLEANRVPPEHKAQLQGVLWIAEREWVDIMVYPTCWPRLPTWRKRVYREDAYIADLAKAVAVFNEELAELVEKVERLRGAPSRLAANLETSLNVLSAG